MTYPDHIRAQARALMFQGYSSERVHNELRELYGEDVPTPATLRAWRAESSEISDEEKRLLQDNEHRLALRFDGLIDRKLDRIEKDIDKVRLPELVMGAGVYRDKPLRRDELKRQSMTPEVYEEILARIAARVTELREARAKPDIIPETRQLSNGN
jgi:hypothetical protein